MATDVTITNAWINEDHYNKSGGGTSFSQQIIETGGSPGATMTWLGSSIAGAIGTYAGVSSIRAEDNLFFSGGSLFPGEQSFVTLGQNVDGFGFRDLYRQSEETLQHIQKVWNDTPGHSAYEFVYRYGGTIDAETVAPTDSIFAKRSYYAKDSAFGFGEGAGFTVGIDGAVADDDFDTYMTWAIKDGADAMAVAMSLYPDLFTLTPSVRLSDLSGTGSRMVVADENGDLSAGDVIDITVNEINFGDSTTYIRTDSAGAMIFEDAIGGPYELSELIAGVGGMVYPGAGIALSTGAAWATSITNNSANWNTAYSHSQVSSGNPHSVTYAELGGSQPAPISHTLLSHTISGETLGHVLAADSATTYSIRQLLGSEINNDLGWTINSLGAATQVPFMNGGATDFSYDDDYVWNASQVYLTIGGGTTSGTARSEIRSTSFRVYSGADATLQMSTYSNSATQSAIRTDVRYGGSVASPITAPTNAELGRTNYYVHDGTSLRLAGESLFKVDGAISTDDFDTEYEWWLKEGAGANALMVTLGVNGFEYAADHSTDQAANDRWIPDWAAVQAYADGVAGMVYPSGSGIPIVVSGTSWGTTITDNSLNWTAGYNHSNVSSGNPHSVVATDILTFTSQDGGIPWTNAGADDFSYTADFVWTGTQLYVPGDVRSSGSKTDDLGTSSAFWDNVYVDRLYVDSTAVYLDVSGSSGNYNMTFTDDITGTVTLATLAAGGVHGNHTGHITSSALATTLVVAAITGQTATTTVAAADELLINDGGAIRRVDITHLETYMQNNLSFGAGVWSKSTTNLSPTTPGDSILLNGTGERIFFDDTSTSIYWTGGTLFFSSTNNVFSFAGSSFFSGDVYGTNNVSDLGDPAAFYADLYANVHYIDDTDTHISNVAGDMTFEDTNTGPVTLADLAAGGSVKEYASFYLSTGGVTAVGATQTTLVVDQILERSDSGIFVLSSNEVTVNKTGVFKIDYQCYFNSPGTARSEFSLWLEVDEGSGYINVPGSTSGIYTRGYDSGSTGTGSLITAVTTGDKFRLIIVRSDGTATDGYQNDGGTRLVFVEV